MGSMVRKLSPLFLKIAGLGLVFFLAAPASQSFAQSANVFANPDQLARLLQEEGFAAKRETDGEGDPLISSSSQGLKWSIFFYGCTNGRNCTAIQFNCGLNAKGAIPVEQLNQWNSNWRYTKAHLRKDGSVALVRDIDLTGGISTPNFKAALASWDVHVGRFKKDVDW
jgi:hypothetical protein